MKARTIGLAIAFTWAVAITLAIARIAAALDTLASRPEPRPLVVGAAPAVPRQVPTPSLAPMPAVEAAAPSDVESSPEQEQARQQAEEVLGRMQSSGQLDDDSIADFREAIHTMQPDERMELLGAFAVAVSRGEIKAGPEELARVLP